MFVFKNCVEQIFDEKTAMISKNSLLATEFFFVVKQLFDEVDPLLSKIFEFRFQLFYHCLASFIFNFN